MKNKQRTVGALMIFAVAIGAGLYSGKKDSAEQAKEKVKIVVKQETAAKEKNTSLQEVKTEVGAERRVEESTANENIKNMACDLFQEQHQLDVERIYAKFESYGMDSMELASEGTFTSLPYEQIRAFSDAKEPSAMLVFGSLMIWEAAIGFHYLDKRSGKIKRDIAKAHKVDLEKLEQARNLLYEAAINGKPLALLELQTSYYMVFSALKKGKEVPGANLEDLIQDSYTWGVLMDKVINVNGWDGFQVDYGQDSYVKNKLKEHSKYTDGDVDVIAKEIIQKANHQLPALLEKWEHDAEVLGHEAYPELLSIEDVVFLDKSKKCAQERTLNGK